MCPNLFLRNRVLSLIISIFLTTSVFGQSGKDGAETISTSGVIFNRYDLLASTASATATTITVTNIANLAASAIAGATNNPYTTGALGYGDLLMIIKMQGATIDVTNTSTYGNITAYNNTGVYELAMVQSVSGNIITLTAALANTFTVSGTQRVQVVRIPRLNSLTINSGASLTAQAWGSSYTGGVVAVEVNGNAVINGSITATGLGFRGGVVNSTATTGYTVTTDYVLPTFGLGGEKGEGIAGFQTDYDAAGRYARGAAANGGGGGNNHNCGGGGGANAGSVAGWSGNGTPDVSGTGWSTAWNLEIENPGFASSSSSGGGRGGYSWSKNDKDALSMRPGFPGPGATWGGNDRYNRGGFGGRPLTYSSNTLFMGGGGGAGDANQTSGSGGGNGGGIIYLAIKGTLSGTGSISSNGATAANSSSLHTDALGGGGGGGAVKLNVQGAISGITVTANGGDGGSQVYGTPANEAEGPGGGGGAGYINVTGTPSITMNALGGNHGNTNSLALTEFIPNGATSGGAGSAVTGNSFVASPDVVLPVRLECFDMISTEKEKVQINWTAYDEMNVLRYELEQSTTPSQWNTLTSQAAQSGNSSIKKYSITINRPAENTYYRLKAVDKNGVFNYTCTKTLKPSSLKNITVTQSNGSLYINHPGQLCNFNLYNSFGQPIKIIINKISVYSTTIDKGGLPKGIYYLQIHTTDETMVYHLMNY